MYCPNCNKEYEGKFCPECGTKLIEKPASQGGLSVNLGDGNAISGGIHHQDSHAVTNVDNSLHNITTNSSTVNNITNVASQKTEMEILQEKKTLYLNACKRAYEDNVLELAEVNALEEERLKLGLDKATADRILNQVRLMSERNARKSELNPIAKVKLRKLTENLQKNEVKALMQQIDSLEPLVNKYDHDELQRKYYLVLAALKSEKCIASYENTQTDNYWNTFWSYLAYIKDGNIVEAENLLESLDRFTSYPEDNMTVLAVAGAIMMGDDITAKELLNAVAGEYTPALQRFVDSIYLLLEPETGKEMGADENTCAFYLVNFFGQKDAKTKAEEERLRKEAEEAERRRKLDEEKKRKAEEEKKRRAEEKAKREAEEQAKREAEEKKKAAEEARLKAEAERKRRGEAVTKSASGEFRVQPQTNKELRSIIVGRLRKDKNADLNDIDISRIRDMSGLFKGLKVGNIDISKWDVSNVTDMQCMFDGCKNFNCDLSNWDVSNVKDMSGMFYGCENFNCDLSNWDVSNVTNFGSMFNGCENFNCNLSNWDVSNVIYMSSMFEGCKKFEGKGLENWDVSHLNKYDISCMFDGCDSIDNIPHWYYGDIIGSNDYQQIKWLPQIRNAAEQGDAYAQFLIGLNYYKYIKDYNEAIKWLSKAGEQGNASAQLVLGLCYYEGQGTAKDYNEAMKWWCKAAEQGLPDAMVEIANLYNKGYGVKQDKNEAMRWWRKAVVNKYKNHYGNFIRDEDFLDGNLTIVEIYYNHDRVYGL